jgi:hypothetical protein
VVAIIMAETPEKCVAETGIITVKGRIWLERKKKVVATVEIIAPKEGGPYGWNSLKESGCYGQISLKVWSVWVNLLKESDRRRYIGEAPF